MLRAVKTVNRQQSTVTCQLVTPSETRVLPRSKIVRWSVQAIWKVPGIGYCPPNKGKGQGQYRSPYRQAPTGGNTQTTRRQRHREQGRISCYTDTDYLTYR